MHYQIQTYTLSFHREEIPIETVNHPSHYSGKVECIEAIEAAISNLSGEEAFNTGQVIKYMWRWKQKGGTEDLRKAQWYLERLISQSPKEEMT